MDDWSAPAAGQSKAVHDLNYRLKKIKESLHLLFYDLLDNDDGIDAASYHNLVVLLKAVFGNEVAGVMTRQVEATDNMFYLPEGYTRYEG
ncbi:MAG: hypothetical protein ACXABY_23110 [Candidatus Thorarchaeota archaeon]|jgi:hypothetical protein